MNLSMFVLDLQDFLKKKAKASKDKRFLGMTKTLEFL